MTTKEQAIENLRDFHREAAAEGLEFCLMDGTLLGAYRDHDFCVGDEDDLDVGVMDAVYDQTPRLTQRLEPLGFKRNKHTMFKGRVEGFGLIRGASHFDVIRINHHPTRPECYNLGWRTDAYGLTAFVYPDKHHAGFEEIEFYGMKFKVPADVEGFLTTRYGDWRTKIDRPKFTWWLDANPTSIRNDYDILPRL